MTHSDFQLKKQQFMQGLWPHKTIALGELAPIGEDVYSIEGTEIPANSMFTNTYDRIIGIDRRQKKIVKEASGETGLKNYRNYINVASNMQNPRNVVIIASPQDRQLTAIIPIVDEYISPSLFFDFAEMMEEETGYMLSDIKFNNSESPLITITYINPQGNTHPFAPGEDFMMDGFYLTWTPSHIELGHYYERLVCANGQTVSEERTDATIYRLSSNEIHKMIANVKNKLFYTQGIEQFGKLFAIASTSRISLSEMGKAQKILIAQGVEKEYVETLIPYEKVRFSYKHAGYYDPHKEHLMKGSGTIWDTYNTLTQFATHTPLWEYHDHRRINIMNGAVSLLKKKPDIVNYMDIY